MKYTIQLLIAFAVISSTTLADRYEFTKSNFKWFEDEDLLNNFSEKNFSYTNSRLPQNLIPISYDLFIIPDFLNFIFHGIVKINVTVREPTSTVVLNQGNIKVLNIDITNNNNENVKVLQSDYNNQTELLNIILYRNLKLFDNLLITLDFEGKLDDDMVGFYKSSYTDKVNKIRYVTHFPFFLIR